MLKITAFVARSFSPDDERKIEPILGFLESFRRSGFLSQTAERAEVESVSKKVRDMIDASDVFVGIFTRRYPVYEPGSLWRLVLPARFGGLKTKRWVAPPWVIQESGYALKAIAAKRKMILFRESGVELPSLQGDLEYIEFDARNFVSAFQKASEMVNGLLSEAAGTVVETVVRCTPPPADASPEPVPAQLVEPVRSPTGLSGYLLEVAEHVNAREFDKAEQAYERGLTYIRTEKPNGEVFWKAVYHRFRYCAGQGDGLEALKDLVKENPNDPDPVFQIGVCFSHFQEYERAAEYHLEAARLEKGDDALGPLVLAARALNKAKRTGSALKLLLDACRAGASGIRVRKELYGLLKQSDDFYKAVAVGELTLLENPGAGDFRFSVAYDYGEKQLNDLSLFHYRILSENDATYSMVPNNLGVTYSLLGLPILAVDSYVKAYESGNTLAADNLARRYLDGGFVSDAAAIVKEAMTKENYEPRLPGTLAALDENRKKEEDQVKTSLEEAENRRRFLLALGEGFLQNAPALKGKWKFPEADIPLTIVDGNLEGEIQIVVNLPPSGLIAVLSGSREPRQEKRRVRFSGQIDGRTCKFRLETQTLSEGSLTGIMLGGGHPVREGYIVFSPDGSSGKVCELEDSKLSKFYSIVRVV